MSNCNYPPASMMAGTQATFTASKYPVDTYTLQFAFNNGKDAPTPVDATIDGEVFSVTVVAPATPGAYAWAEVYTKIADDSKYVGRQGRTTITPDILATATPSTAQLILTRLESELKTGKGMTRGSASFNGESVSWHSPAELQSAVTYWQSIVFEEQRQLAAAMGQDISGLIRPVFIQPGSCF